ncbi:MAG: hypothetical protein EXQ52_12935 [Bryobacterales bacterium]|nr:hypothetical protein [Bryobacterales bacterium]
MNEMENVRAALRALAQRETGWEEAPARVESALIEEFRLRKANRAGRARMVWGALAAALVMFSAYSFSGAPAPARPEIATPFFAVPGNDPFERLDRGRLVRVRLPRSSLRAFGLPMNEERAFETVKADVVLGEDGLARAIRFVQ